MPDRLLGNQPRISSAQAQWLANAQRMCFPPVPRRPAAATTNTPSATQRLALFGGQELLELVTVAIHLIQLFLLQQGRQQIQ